MVLNTVVIIVRRGNHYKTRRQLV